MAADANDANQPSRTAELEGACHEIANALAAIVGWAELAEDPAGPTKEAALARIAACARIAGAQARRVLRREPAPADPSEAVDVSTAITEAVESLAPTARKAGVAIDSRIDAGLVTSGRRDHVVTIGWNLALNAIEASPQGERIGVFAVCHGNEIRITVADNGSGIPPQLSEQVFEPRFTTKPTGNGLGLALVREAASALGGTVELQHRPRGSTFVVKIPRAALAHSASSTLASSKRASSRPQALRDRAVRILVVDDHADIRDMMAAALSLRGADVTTVASIANALATAGVFDLACVDVNLADGSGVDLVARLHADARARVCILMSGNRSSATGDELAAAGPDARWLSKPFGIDDLVAVVRDALAAVRRA